MNIDISGATMMSEVEVILFFRSFGSIEITEVYLQSKGTYIIFIGMACNTVVWASIVNS